MWFKNGHHWTSAGEAKTNQQARLAAGATAGGYPAQETATFVAGSIDEKHKNSQEVHYDENAFKKL